MPAPCRPTIAPRPAHHDRQNRKDRQASPATKASRAATPDYLRKILTAKVYDVAQETELTYAHALSARTGNAVWFKREDTQPVFSFKLRGAYNKMASLTPDELKRGVIAASAGNHAQGVALSAARLQCKAIIAMPTTTPR